MGTARPKAAASNVTDLRPQRQADAAAVDALHDTVRLVHDLAEALAAQTARARRQIEGLGPAGPTADLVGRLSTEAQHMKRHCDELADALTTVDGTATGDGEIVVEDAKVKRPPHRAPPAFARRENDPSETLAIDLKLGGMSAANVEAFLTDTFSIENAHEIVERVFGAQP